MEFVTPLFPGQTLTGKVYFGTPRPGVPLVNYISVEDPRLRLKLGGFATIDPNTTAITAHFTDQPQVPFESFNFVYTDPGNGRATLTSPTACGDYSVTADMTPWNGGAVAVAEQHLQGGRLRAAGVRARASACRVADTQAGGPAALTVHIGRPDKNLRLQDAKRLAAARPDRPLPGGPGVRRRRRARRTCAPTPRRSARRSVAVGTGPAPLALPGKVYLTKGFDGGIAGLAVVGQHEGPGARPRDGRGHEQAHAARRTPASTSSPRPLPQTLQGIPTVYRAIDLTIDQPGFMQNATTCAPQTVGGTFTAVGGTTATANAPYQATGCENAAVRAEADARRSASKGQTAANTHPPLNVTISQPDGQAAQRKTVVSLPDRASASTSRTCRRSAPTRSSTAARARPGSKIGTVSAVTPLLPAPLSGGVYLTQGAKLGALPGIALDLGIIRLKGTVALGARLVTTFDSDPGRPAEQADAEPRRRSEGRAEDDQGHLHHQRRPSRPTYAAQSGADGEGDRQGDAVGCAVSAQSKTLTRQGLAEGIARKQPDAVADASPRPRRSRACASSCRRTLKLASAKTLARSSRVTVGGKRYKKTKVKWSSSKVSFTGAKGTRTKKIVLSLPTGVLKLKRSIKVRSKQTFTVYGLTTAGKLVSVKVRLTAGR